MSALMMVSKSAVSYLWYCSINLFERL